MQQIIKNTIFGRKEGMDQILEKNRLLPVTIVYVYKCTVITNINNNSIIWIDSKEKLKYPQIQTLKKYGFLNNISPNQKIQGKLKEIKGTYKPGTTLDVNAMFEQQEVLTVQARSKGKGFSGVMKRHNFSGQPASHGNSLTHRAAGSTGSQDVGKTYKGRKMAGRLGYDRVTKKGIRLKQIIQKDNHTIMVLSGSIPGCKNRLIRISQ